MKTKGFVSMVAAGILAGLVTWYVTQRLSSSQSSTIAASGGVTV